MKNRFSILLLGSALFLAALPAQPAAAAPSVVIAPAGKDIYAIQGVDFSGISGVDITVAYNAAAVNTPRLVQGGLVGGSLMAVNTAAPGTFRLALVRVTEINGSGTIATASFKRASSSYNDILSISAKGISPDGKDVHLPSQVVNAPAADVTTAPASASGTDGQASTTSVPSKGNGGAAQRSGPSAAEAPVTASAAVGTPPATSAATAAGIVGAVSAPASGGTASGETASAGADAHGKDAETAVQDAMRDTGTDKERPLIAKAETPDPIRALPTESDHMYPSVLERFRTFKGKRTPESLSGLFGADGSQVRQEPRIALSDGTSTVKVLLELDPQGENNNMSLDGVTLVSLVPKGKGQWIAELLPMKGAVAASISIPLNNKWHVMPLVVAPPMDVNIDRSGAVLTEKDFTLFLKQRGTAKQPRFDLNHDGVRDHVDEYIFTANYLAQSARRTAPPAAPFGRGR